MRITDEYLEAYARYQKETSELVLRDVQLHDRLVSAVGDMLIALHEANGGYSAGS